MGRSPRHWVPAALLLLAGVIATPAAGETPPRDLAGDMVVTRYAFFKDYYGEFERYGGLWRLDPETWHYTRLRPFLSSFGSDNSTPPGGITGGEGYLTIHGDIASYRTWPATLDFDLQSWRLIRRIPEPPDAIDTGWIVRGPNFGQEDAAQLGLQAGVYGFPRCILTRLTSGLNTPPRTCLDPPWPSAQTPGTIALLFTRSELAPDSVSAFAEVPDPGFELPTYPPTDLGLDLGRHGLWTPTAHGFRFLPVTDATIGEPSDEVQLDLAAFDQDAVEVLSLAYQPSSDTLFGLANKVPPYYHGASWLFSADPDTGHALEIGSWESLPPEGVPSTWSTIGQPPEESTQLIPIVGGGEGRRGTTWSTDLWFFNPSGEATTAQLRRVTHPSQTRSITVEAHASITIQDALTWLGAGSAGDGTPYEAVVVTAPAHWGEDLVVFGRITNHDPATGGTYGHALPALPGRLGYSNHIPYQWRHDDVIYRVTSTALDSSYFLLDLADPGRFRANMGAVNDTDEPLGLELQWASSTDWNVDADSWPDAIHATLTIPAHGVVLKALRDLFPPEIFDRFPPKIAVRGDRPAAVWLSIIDNTTGDATFVPFTVFQLFNDSEDDRLVIPGVGRTHGANGSIWRTDIIGPQDYSLPLNIAWVGYRPSAPAEDCGGAAMRQELDEVMNGEFCMPETTWFETLETLYSNPVYSTTGFHTAFRDIIGRFPACADDFDTRGALEVAVGNWTAGYSRTYTTRPDGGTYGSMLPFYPPRGWPVQHFAGLAINDEQRVNLGLYNGLDQPVTHRLVLYAAEGTLAASTELELAPHEHRQEPLQAFLGALPDGLYGLTVVPLDDPDNGVEGRSWAYVSIVDNRTNDPINLW